MNKQSVSTDLIINLPAVMTAEAFTDEQEFEKLYSKVKEAVDQHVPDLSTKTGRDAIASLAYKVARTKTALIGQGKKLTEDWREKTKKVNAACNLIEERLDTLKDEVRKPLTEWEQAEQDRIDGHKARLESLIAMTRIGYGRPSSELRELLADVQKMPLGAAHWEEYAPQASVAHQDAVDTLSRLLAAAEKQEAEAEELERLRAEKIERDRVEAERLAKEQAAREAEERAERERQAEAARVEREARLAEEARQQAEREAQERIAAAERAAKEAEERAAREVAEAKESAERQAAAERQRVADQKAAEEAEQRRRDADKEHRKTINNAIVAELIECAGISNRQAEKIVVHIVSGLVPNVTLKY
ncbi:hypothetical protein ACNT8L_05830 [Brucella intermedia]|uniref:hypothetical protein n=1 Tax=Brucella intermedia TaxID=94625 RepID=UPI003AB2FFCE